MEEPVFTLTIDEINDISAIGFIEGMRVASAGMMMLLNGADDEDLSKPIDEILTDIATGYTEGMNEFEEVLRSSCTPFVLVYLNASRENMMMHLASRELEDNDS